MYKGLSVIKIESMLSHEQTAEQGPFVKTKEAQESTGFEEVFLFLSELLTDRNELDEDTVSAAMINMFTNRLQRLRQLKISFYTDT